MYSTCLEEVFPEPRVLPHGAGGEVDHDVPVADNLVEQTNDAVVIGLFF